MPQYDDIYSPQKIDETVDKLVSIYGDGGIWPSAKQWRTLLENNENEKIFVIHFFKFKDRAFYPDDPSCNISGREAAQDRYNQYGEEASRQSGLKVTHVGMDPMIAIGEEENWDSVCVFEYPNRRAFLSIFLDTDYQRSIKHRNAGAEIHRTVIATASPMDW